MTTKRKVKIALMLVLIAGITYCAVSGYQVKLIPQKAGAQTTNDGCPAGSYNIGESKDGQVICKLEPTGCPYGDSIPLGPDCDKHAPKDPTPPDPDRPYYDGSGNQYDYQGNLISPAPTEAAKGSGCQQ
jgi:hypothetical protein